jgi:tetratricopeptide (TPR) repeat protein
MISLRFLARFYGGLKSLSSGFYYNWGMNYARWGQPARAMYYLNKAARLNTTPQIFYQRGLLFIAMGQPRSAIIDFNSAIASDPQHMDAYLNRSIMFTMMGSHEAAKNDVDSAVGLGADRSSLEAQIATLREELD